MNNYAYFTKNCKKLVEKYRKKIKSNLAKSTNVRYNRIPRLMDQKTKGEETNERQRV